MRLAIIAAARAEPSPEPLLGERDAMLVSSRLALDDLGFEVLIVDPEVDLAEQVDEALVAHEGSLEALLFYASCLLAVVEEGDCFLCLDPKEPDVGDALTDVAEVLASARAPQTMMWLELRYDQPDVTRGGLNDVLSTVTDSIDPSRTGIEVIAAIRPVDAHPERIPSRMTAALLEQIDTSEGSLDARRAYAAAVQRADLGTWVHAVGHRPGAAPFRMRDEGLEAQPRALEAQPQAAQLQEAQPQDALAVEASLPPSTDPEPTTAPSAGIESTSRTAPDGSFALSDAGEQAGLDDEALSEPLAEEAFSEPPGEKTSSEALPEAPPPPPPPPPPSSARSFEDRRPPPPSERRESSSVAWPSRRSRPAPLSQPKVVIGAARTSSPGPSSERPDSARPSSEGPDSEKPSSEGGRSSRPPKRASDRPRALHDTSADGPEAKRLRDAAEKAIGDAAAVRRERLGSNGAAEHGAGAALHGVADESSDISIDEISVDEIADEISAEIEINVEAEALLTKKMSSAPPPPSRRKKAAEMTVEDHIEAGDLARRLGRDDEAVSHYKKGLAKLGTTHTPERAEIYVRVGEVMRRGGKTRLAISNFDKALQIIPAHRGALENLLTLEADNESWRNVGVLEDRLLAALEGDERLGVLLSSGDRWREKARDRRRARERYDQARTEFPKRREPLEHLLRLYEEDGAIDHALDMRRRIADLIADPRERARYYFELGEKCLFDFGREDEGYGAFELALDSDPTMLEALEVLATALAEGQEWGELERVYAKMIDKFSSRERNEATVTVLGELHHRSALLFRDHLEDSRSALEAVARELALRPESLSAQIMAAELALDIDDGQRGLSHLRAAAALEPHRAETYHQLFSLGQRYEAHEISFLASSVTQVLGEADDRERIIHQEHRPAGVPVLSQPLDDAAWHWLLEEREPAVDAVMCAIAPAVLRLRVRQLDAEGKLPDLPAEARQDLKKSTLSVVRSIAWASQFLAIPAPAVYLFDEAPSPLWAPFAREQSIVVAREALRGRTVSELAFLVGHHLTMRLPEHELVAHLQNVDELTACFLAAIRIVLGSSAGSGDLASAAAHLAPLLAAEQTSAERDALEEAVSAFSEAGGRVNLRSWVLSVERSATRAGLVLCGDLETAVRAIREEGDRPSATVAERIDDLLAFTVSAEHARIRDRLGTSLERGDEPSANRSAVSALR